jgi:hypothetical protein
MSKSLRAKMRVSSIDKHYRQKNCPDRPKPDGGVVESMELKLMVVGSQPGTDDPNKEWSASTPSGELRLLVSCPGAFPFIESMPGKEFYIDITEV